MKPYFAKYIPVEGEIEVGDYVLDVATNLVDKMAEAARGHKIPQMNQVKNFYKKVKLFLCSRDIQPDDAVLLSVRVDPVPKKLHPDDFEIGKHLGCFKVIGEISSAAKWIKEGDEFDEVEVQHNHICYDSPGNTGCCFHCNRSKGWDSEDYNYVIKGPCGHFH